MQIAINFHSGTIDVKSTFGIGSEFTFSLPISTIEFDVDISFSNSEKENNPENQQSIIYEDIFVSEFNYNFLRNEILKK